MSAKNQDPVAQKNEPRYEKTYVTYRNLPRGHSVLQGLTVLKLLGEKVYVFKKKWIKYCLIFEQFCMQVEGFLSLLLFLYFVMLQQIESFLIAIWCHFTLSVTPLLFP